MSINASGQTVSDMHTVEANNKNNVTGEDNGGEESDDSPCFILKPFEKSIEPIEADGQTAIKVFNVGEGPGDNGFELEDDEDEFDFGDESEDRRAMMSDA